MRVALALSTLLVGCSAHTEPTPAPATVFVRLPSGDCYPGAACTFDFGPVDVDAHPIVAFNVLNTGETDDAVTRIQLVGDPVFGLSSVVSGALPAGGVFPFAISVAPLHAATIQTVLVLHTAGNPTSIQIHVKVEGTVFGLQTSPGCDFGDVPVGTTSAPCTIVISNPNAVDVPFDYVILANNVFRVLGELPPPQTLHPGGRLSIPIVAQPAAPGLTNGFVAIVRGSERLDGSIVLRVIGT